MPAANPFTDSGDGPVLTFAQNVNAGTVASTPMYSSPNAATNTNAAGTSENVAMHVAIIILLALVAAFLFKQSGFRAVVAVGGG